MWYWYLKKLLKSSGLGKKTKDLIKQALQNTYSPITFCINHQPISPATKTIRDHVRSATNPTAFPRKLKIAPTTLPAIAGNDSTAFLASLLSASASLCNHFSKAPSPFGGEPYVPPQKTLVEIVIERAVSIENMVIPWSKYTVRILSPKYVFWSRSFWRICLILATCVWRSFRFCDSISSLPYFLVFKSSNQSLYNCLCSSV